MKRKILIIVPSLEGGGAEKFIVKLSNNLDRNKFIIYLVILNSLNSVYIDDLKEDLIIFNFYYKKIRFSAIKIIKLIWFIRPDILFTTLVHLNMLIGVLGILFPRRMKVYGRETIILSKLYEHSKYLWFLKKIYPYLYLAFDKIISQSSDMENDLINNFGLKKNKSIVINNPIDFDRINEMALLPIVNNPFIKDGVTINFVSCGRLEYQKGFDLLIEAISICKINLNLVILGSGVEKDRLIELARNFNVLEKINFVGFQINPYQFFKNADAFILSSRYEGFPNVILEAIACGTPVIAMPAPGGIIEILKDIDGCLVSKNVSASSLADSILSFKSKYRLHSSSINKYRMDRIIRSYETNFLD